jgi:hypothetical protein
MLFNASLSLFSSWNIGVNPKHSFDFGVDDKEAPVLYFGMVIRQDHVLTWGDLFFHYPLVLCRVQLSLYKCREDK